MKPVIITLNSDNKVVMSVEEFKRHMDSAYNQGYSDGTSSASIGTPTYYGNNRWWTDVTCSSANKVECTNDAILADTVTAEICGSVTGSCATIKDYIKNKGE